VKAHWHSPQAADISEFEKRRASEASTHEYEGVSKPHKMLSSVPPNGDRADPRFCIGGGLEMALACDLRYASDASRFAIPAARLGIGYGVHGTNRLVATVGHAMAREIMFTGRRYSADDALAMGLVNRVLPEAELDEYVRLLAVELAGNAPLSIAASKRIIDTIIAPQGDFGETRELIVSCMRSEDYVEGRRAFMEKRPPKFSGR
jgi:enoyl-CoA hydratase/carnithine racemase